MTHRLGFLSSSKFVASRLFPTLASARLSSLYFPHFMSSLRLRFANLIAFSLVPLLSALLPYCIMSKSSQLPPTPRASGSIRFPHSTCTQGSAGSNQRWKIFSQSSRASIDVKLSIKSSAAVTMDGLSDPRPPRAFPIPAGGGTARRLA